MSKHVDHVKHQRQLIVQFKKDLRHLKRKQKVVEIFRSLFGKGRK